MGYDFCFTLVCSTCLTQYGLWRVLQSSVFECEVKRTEASHSSWDPSVKVCIPESSASRDPVKGDIEHVPVAVLVVNSFRSRIPRILSWDLIQRGLLSDATVFQAVKILEWFQHDADLPKWQSQVSGSGSAAGNRRSSRNSPASTAPNSGSGRSLALGLGNAISGRGSIGAAAAVAVGGGGSGDGASTASFDARGMDFVIDEMALACQVGCPCSFDACKPDGLHQPR